MNQNVDPKAKCSECGIEKARKFQKFNCLVKIFVDERGKQWNGLMCPHCWTSYANRLRAQRKGFIK